MKIFLENRTPSVFSSYKVLQSRSNSGKTSSPFLRKTEQTGRRTVQKRENEFKFGC